MLITKEESITAPVTLHHLVDLHKTIARIEQELRAKKLSSYGTIDGTVICRKFLKVSTTQQSYQPKQKVN